ncbi:MAG: hypothetical protein P4M00_16375 [Azospirillaceae bacterium]|nr:hypothetical protein [Azospirillaceae bacterium]
MSQFFGGHLQASILINRHPLQFFRDIPEFFRVACQLTQRFVLIARSCLRGVDRLQYPIKCDHLLVNQVRPRLQVRDRTVDRRDLFDGRNGLIPGEINIAALHEEADEQRISLGFLRQ